MLTIQKDKQNWLACTIKKIEQKNEFFLFICYRKGRLKNIKLYWSKLLKWRGKMILQSIFKSAYWVKDRVGCKQPYNKFNIQGVKGWVSRKIVREGCKGDDENDTEDEDGDDEEGDGINNASRNSESNGAAGHDKTDVLLADQLRVLWMDESESTLNFSDVEVVDRGFLHGDFVAAASDPTGQVGVVVDVNICVDLLAHDGSIIKDVSSKNLKRIRDFTVGDYVVLAAWTYELV